VSSNPYKPPAANVELSEQALEVPDEILKKIKQGWIAGLVSAAFTVIFVVMAMAGNSILGINAWGFIDVVVMAGLAFGVYKKSRTCAVLLLAFFALNKVLMWMEAGTPTGWPLALAFFWFYIMGVVGTFQYHSWKKENNIE
jgi:serine/threonine-protein kinase